MRVPLGVTLESRDGTLTKDAKVVNGLVEVKGEQSSVRKRPGTAELGVVRTGTAQGIFSWNGIKTIQGDFINSGTLATITSPTSTNLSPSTAGLMFDGQQTSDGAGTPRLMIKNRTQAWAVNRAGTASAITFADDMGAGTYTVTSLTRSGTTATATIATDPGFNVGQSVTIAGADQSDYNGAQTVTSVTLGQNTPSRNIDISITRSGTTATATSLEPHGLTSGTYTISGANESAYNGSKSITVTSTTTFTYTVSVTAADAITGTWNSADKAATVTLSGSDLTAQSVNPAGVYGHVRATTGKSSGRWVWEITKNNSQFGFIGVCTSALSLTASPAGATAWYYAGDSSAGFLWGGASQASESTTLDDKIGVVLDMDEGTVTFYKNGSPLGGFTGLTGTIYPFFGAGPNGLGNVTANFAGSFTYNYDAPTSPASGAPLVTDPGAISDYQFTFEVANSPTTPATGTITAAGNVGMARGIAYLNGYFCVMDINGVIWNSASDDPTTWGALDFITADNEAGAGKALAKSGSYLVALKEFSTEYYYDAQNPTGSPFSPVENGFTKIGCASGDSVATAGGGLAWIAQDKEGERSVYFMLGLEQKKISTPDVDRVLAEDFLTEVHAYGLDVDGHSLYLLTLVDSDVTLAYDFGSGVWSQWTTNTASTVRSVSSITRDGDTATVTTTLAHTLSDGDPAFLTGADQAEYNGYFQASVLTPTTFKIKVAGTPVTPATGTITVVIFAETYFKLTKCVNHNGVGLFLHEDNGKIYRLLPNYTLDSLGPINFFIRTSRMDGGSTDNKRMKSLRVIGDALDEVPARVDDVAMVRWSDDDCRTFTKYRFVDLSEIEPELRRCGAFKRRTVEVRHIGNASANLSALEMEIT